MNSNGSNSFNQERTDGFSERLAQARIPKWKRVLDCTLVIITAPVWLPLAVLLAVWVKLVSPGPALFRQERIGHLGNRFLCLKFRTMKVHADTSVHREHLNHLMTSNGPMKKLDSTGDARLIVGGVWLRALGVDELPQLINVLRGEMSLVGPRPSTPYEYEMFQPRHRRRCETLPGLTGLWQVSGKNRTTFERMMELDVSYVESKNLLMDVRIIVMTLPAIAIQSWDVRKARRSMAASPSNTLIVARASSISTPIPPSTMDTQNLVRTPVLTTAHRSGLGSMER